MSRITVALSEEEQNALEQQAQRNLRATNDQAHYYIQIGLAIEAEDTQSEQIVCANCKFYGSPQNKSGQCQRYAPRPRELMASELIDAKIDDEKNSFFPVASVWPLVHSVDWCGEFVKRDG